MKLGKPGTNQFVTRYPISVKPNVVTPLAAPYADPADKSGVSALEVVPGVMGTAYVAGLYDVRLDAVALAPGPLGNLIADDGKQFLVATVTSTNRTTRAENFDGSRLNITLKTDDGKLTDFNCLTAKLDNPFQGESLDPGESATERYVFQIPKGEGLKSLSISERVADGASRAFLYDVSTVK